MFPSISPLAYQRRFLNQRYSIRLYLYGYNSMQRRIVWQPVWWSCCRLANDHAAELIAARDYARAELDAGRIDNFWVIECGDK